MAQTITAAQQTALSQLYVAFFNRAADSSGLGYWANDLLAGKSIENIAQSFYNTEAARPYYSSGQTAEQFVESFYSTVLGRAADTAGKAYWVAQLKQPGQTQGSVAVAIVNAVTSYAGTDAAALTSQKLFNAKVEVSTAYAVKGGSVAGATGVLSGVVDAATAATAIANLGSTIPSATEGLTFTLAAGAPGDAFLPTSAVAANKTTAGDDTFRAVSAVSLETTDVIDGGAGNDTLNIAAGALVVAGAAPVLKSIETINITSNLASDILTLTDATGVNALNVIATAASTVTINDAALSTTFGTGAYAGAAINSVIDINILASTAGTADTLKLALANNNLNTVTITSTADAASIEAITVAANGSSGAVAATGNTVADLLVVDAGFTGVKTLTVTGNGNSSITLASAVLATIDASNANGNNTYVAIGALAKTVTTGSGNDNITTGAGNDTINSGAGNDTITAGVGTNTYNGGLGADIYTGNAVGTDTFIIQTSTIEDLGFDTVLGGGFTTAVDTIKFFGGVAATAANYTEVVQSGAGFVSARSAALTSFAADANLKYVVVGDAVNSYVFFDGNGDHLLSTNGSDFAVMLTGLVGATGAVAGIAFGDIVAA